MKTVMTPEKWEEAKKMRAEGKSMKEIGLAMGVTQGRISQKLGKKKEQAAGTG